MQRRTSLFIVSKDTGDAEITEAANAARSQQAHIVCFVLGTLPGLPHFAYGAPTYGGMVVPEEWLELLKNTRTEVEIRVREVNALLSQAGTSGEVLQAVCTGRELQHQAARRALSCDIAFPASSLRQNEEVFRQAVHGLLFRSSIGVMVNGNPHINRERIFLAWNNCLASARAAHAALPYFLAAKEIVIGCFDPEMSTEQEGEDPGTDVAAWLSHHGCNVTVSQFPSGGQEIARCIQDRAEETGADLIIMGAYGHSRTREAIFGGTTRTMLEQTSLPVFFAH